MSRLRHAARRQRKSVAAVVREAVEEHLGRDPEDRERRKRLAKEVSGAFRSDLPTPYGPVSEHHDAYLDDAYDQSQHAPASGGHGTDRR